MQAFSSELTDDTFDIDSMSITEGRFHKLETRVNEIGENVAKIQGAGSVAQKSPDAGLITILSIVGFAVIAYWGWIGAEVVHHGKQIDAIIIQLDPATPLRDISQLKQEQFAKALPTLKQITERPFPSQPLPQPILRDVAQKLLRVDERSPDYWPTVLQFIQFASAGLSLDVPPPGPPNFVIAKNIGNISFAPISHLRVKLDGGDLVNTRFEHSRIIFTENPVHMKDVVFIDCVFEMPISATPNRYLQDASRMLLASELNSTKIPAL